MTNTIFQRQLFIISCHGSVKLKRLGPEALHNTLKRVASVALLGQPTLNVGISWNIICGYKRNTCWLVAMSWCWSFWIFDTPKKGWDYIHTALRVWWRSIGTWSLDIKGRSSTWPVCFSSIFPLVPSTWLMRINFTPQSPHNPLMSTGHLDSERLTGLARPASNNESISSQPLREVSYIILWADWNPNDKPVDVGESLVDISRQKS